jgi:hypothetical protein
MNNFPPRTKHKRDVQIILEFLASVAGEQETVYMSAPITSGKRLLEFKQNGSNSFTKSNYCEESSIQIISHNRLHAKTVAQKIRTKLDTIIIDPTLVGDIDEWTQDDYRFLWGKVIEKYAKTVIYIDDWNYSNGCAYEFLVAKQLNVKTLDERFNLLSLDKGILLIKNAINDLKERFLPAEFLESVVNELNKINVGEYV